MESTSDTSRFFISFLNILIFLGLILLSYSLQNFPPTEKSRPTYFGLSSGPRLLRAYVSGNKRLISRREKRAHRQLGLLHLFTPSGLHLSALMSALSPLKLFSFQLYRHSKRLLLLALFALINLFNLPYFSLGRMSLLGLTKSFSSSEKALFFGLIISFTYDLLWGSFQYSPVSFFLSLIFCSVIIKNVMERTFIHIPFQLFIIQLFVSSLFDQKVSLLALGANYLLVPLFTFIFPLSLLETSLSSSNYIFSAYQHVLGFFKEALPYFPLLKISIEGALFLSIIVIFKQAKWLPLIILIPLNPSPKRTSYPLLHSPHYLYRTDKTITIKKRVKNGECAMKGRGIDWIELKCKAPR